MKIKNFKMQVTPEQSEKIQEILFAHGGEWQSLGAVITSTEERCLYYEDNVLTCNMCDVTDTGKYIDGFPILTYDQFIKLCGEESIV